MRQAHSPESWATPAPEVQASGRRTRRRAPKRKRPGSRNAVQSAAARGPPFAVLDAASYRPGPSSGFLVLDDVLELVLVGRSHLLVSTVLTVRVLAVQIERLEDRYIVGG